MCIYADKSFQKIPTVLADVELKDIWAPVQHKPTQDRKANK